MARQLFALASVTALTGFAASIIASGCAANEEKKEDISPTMGIDGGKRADAAAAAKDAGPEGPQTCIIREAIDATKFSYNKAGVTTGACTTDELNALGAFVAKADSSESIKISDWKASVSEGCAKCAFSDVGGATWGPILVQNDKLEGVNRGGCIEAVSGNEQCGRSYQQATECMLGACLANCKTQEEFDECRADPNTILQGPCKAAYEALNKDCGSSLSTYEETCKGTKYTFEGPMRVMCINGAAK